MNQMRNILAIQSASSFVSGILSIIIPLLLIERNISIQSIGLIFAIYPIVFQLGRISFGIISDFLGRKPFYILNIVFGAIMNMTYYFSFSVLGYAAGKFFEGLKDATIWSVNRASILEQNGNERSKQRSLIRLQIVVMIANALGIFAAGFLITYIFFSNVLLFCAIVGIIALPSALSLKKNIKRKMSISRLMHNINVMKKNAVFRKFILIFCILGIFSGLTTDYIFPAFLKSRGFEAGNIGILIGIHMLMYGIIMFLFRRWANLKSLIVIAGLLTFVFMIPLGFSSNIMIFFLIIFLGISGGMSQLTLEMISVKTTDKKSCGCDIGMLYFGFHIARSITLAFSGFIIATFGFGILFSIAAFIMMVYTFFASMPFRR